jgi:hypothetical protein
LKKLSIGLLAAIVIAIAAAPAEAAKKKSKKAKKGKTEVAMVDNGSPLGRFGCFLSGMAGTKSPGPACGR